MTDRPDDDDVRVPSREVDRIFLHDLFQAAGAMRIRRSSPPAPDRPARAGFCAMKSASQDVEPVTNEVRSRWSFCAQRAEVRTLFVRHSS